VSTNFTIAIKTNVVKTIKTTRAKIRAKNLKTRITTNKMQLLFLFIKNI